MMHFVLDKNTIHEIHFWNEGYSLCHGHPLTFQQFAIGVLLLLNSLIHGTGSF